MAVYYAARSLVEVRAPTVSGEEIEIAVPLSVIPRKLATASIGDVLRVQFRGPNVQAGPLLSVTVTGKTKTLGRYLMRLRILDWNKLARYWRARIEDANGAPDL